MFSTVIIHIVSNKYKPYFHSRWFETELTVHGVSPQAWLGEILRATDTQQIQQASGTILEIHRDAAVQSTPVDSRQSECTRHDPGSATTHHYCYL